MTCVYLTDGSGYGVNTEIRNRESLLVLSSIGISKKDVIFLGDQLRFKDSALLNRCQDLLDALNHVFANNDFEKIYCPAWEGGHVDHDVVHLVALAFAKSCEAVITTWEFSLYHAYRMPRRFFRVMSLLKSSTPRDTEKLSFFLAIKWAFLFLYYRSQWKTWLGLCPEAILKIILLRKAHVQEASIAKISKRPHRGLLLYETRFGTTYDDFKKNTEKFRHRHF